MVPPTEGTAASDVYASKALARFLSLLGTRAQPVLLDLGPVVGGNVTFFGEQLHCKIMVEDLYADVERHVTRDTVDQLPAFFGTRLADTPDQSVDGILCWDVFDYLDRDAARALARQLTRTLRPDGVLLAFFGAAQPEPGAAFYTRHLVVDTDKLERRPYPASRGKLKPLPNRDIELMFAPLKVTEQFLLKTKVREVLLRKPAVAPVEPA